MNEPGEGSFMISKILVLLLWAPMEGTLYQPQFLAVFPMVLSTMIKEFPSSL